MGRPELRARVLPDLARHLQDDSAAAASLDRGAAAIAGRSSAPTALVVGAVRAEGRNLVVQVRLIEVATGAAVFAQEYSGRREQSAVLRAHDRRRDPPAAGAPARRRADQARVHVRPRRRARRRARPARATSRTSTSPTTTAPTSAGSPSRSRSTSTPAWSPDAQVDRVHALPLGLSRHHRCRHLRGRQHAAGTGERIRDPQLPAGVVARRQKLAFMSNRDGNPEIYVVNRDGSGLRRLTNHPENDVTPTWSPSGNQIAFTSNRTGRPQIWIMNADGSGQQQITRETWCDRPTWSPAPVQRDRLCVAGGRRLRHQDLRFRDAKHEVDHRRRRQQREPGVLAERSAHRVHVDPRRQVRRSSPSRRDGKDLRQITKAGREPLSELVELIDVERCTMHDRRCRCTAEIGECR